VDDLVPGAHVTSSHSGLVRIFEFSGVDFANVVFGYFSSFIVKEGVSKGSGRQHLRFQHDSVRYES
jgi:hypothetical protein